VSFNLRFLVIYGFIGYYMVGLQPDGEAFGRFLLCMLLIGNASHSFGLLLSALFPHPQIGIMLSTLAMVPFMLYTGFFINLSTVPAYLSWLPFILPHRYIFEALCINEFIGTRYTCLPTELLTIPSDQGALSKSKI